jgi:predicted kinase
MAVLSSDRIRKELAGLSPAEHFPSAYGTGLYTEAWTGRTYDEMLSRAARLLAQGEVDTSRGDSTGRPDQPGEAARQAMSVIRPHGPEHVWPARPYLLPD